MCLRFHDNPKATVTCLRVNLGRKPRRQEENVLREFDGSEDIVSKDCQSLYISVRKRLGEREGGILAPQPP